MQGELTSMFPVAYCNGNRTDVPTVEAAGIGGYDSLLQQIHQSPDCDRSNLSHVRNVYRETTFITGPTFINKGDAKVGESYTPRALELAFHEPPFRPLGLTCDIDSTLGLAKLARGAVTGVDQLYRLGWLHHDMKPESLGIDGNGEGLITDLHLAAELNGPFSEAALLKRFGISPYVAPTLLNPEMAHIQHSWWHDVTSILLIVLSVALSRPDGIERGMATETNEVWKTWNQGSSGNLADAADSKQDTLCVPEEREIFMEPCREAWPGLSELVEILGACCGMDVPQNVIQQGRVEEVLAERAASGELSLRRIIQKIDELIEILIR
ncbi:hypothetical protein MVLG_06382 [Microbotryum lychnidis-dioicae p1A1 Lamole]|uniref:Protein kinase domain-containing protein n=1 Tax=Microbotryum lychnidis-dioicae (strain p1A1 Lamole / MvSl-1064) TaxID=683840 RepID=U5HH42_USTV1|nr:hypothetical protein MVLG_06382 [Microbotryum lychnidis-dioicae p1A1 Lamole]|eukprot:KDE03121.1 hypothetical protein MVLG_06382 [Microbotryum lychnidis-dioicae p1A1 Lamole]